jgi:hypothetical protein
MTSGAGVRPADASGGSARRGRPRRADWAVAIVVVLLHETSVLDRRSCGVSLA